MTEFASWKLLWVTMQTGMKASEAADAARNESAAFPWRLCRTSASLLACVLRTYGVRRVACREQPRALHPCFAAPMAAVGWYHATTLTLLAVPCIALMFVCLLGLVWFSFVS